MNALLTVETIETNIRRPRKKTAKLTKDELVIGLLNREGSVMSVLYDMYSSALFGVILRIVRKEEIAEDVLQDTFVKIWKAFPSYDKSKGRLFTWMSNMARNMAIDHLRSKASRNSNQTFDIENEARVIDIRFNVSANTDRIGLKDMTSLLKPEHKCLIDLIYYKGYTHAEAAEELSIPQGTLKTRLRIAMQTLRKFFN